MFTRMIRNCVFLILWGGMLHAGSPLVVEIVQAKSQADKQDISLTGEIVAHDTLIASFTSSGRIASVEVQEGDAIPAGSVLARMESVQQAQSLRAAVAGVLTATADRDQASEDLSRQEALLVRGATTRIARDSAADAQRVAAGALTQAQAELDRAQKAIDDTVLITSQAGTVTGRLAEPGQVIGAAQPVVTMALGTIFDAVFQVPEVLASGPEVSTQIILAPLDDPAQVFSGVIRKVSPLVDPATGTVEITLSVSNKPNSLSYGDAVRGTAERLEPPSVALPHTTLSATADGPAVWVVDPGTMTVSIRQVIVNRYETSRVVLTSGVQEGELVVARGAHLLYPGRIVKAANEGTE